MLSSGLSIICKFFIIVTMLVSRKLMGLEAYAQCSKIFLAKESFRRFSLHPNRNVFRTKVDDNISAPFNISHKSNLFFIGSCFSENISKKLKSKKFTIKSNPQGILFNPISIEKCIYDIINQNKLNLDRDVFHDKKSELYHIWDAHSDFSSLILEEMFRNMEESRSNALKFLRGTNVTFITLGTCKVHYLIDQGRVVANCHQQPNSLFKSRILEYDELVASLKNTILLLRECNPQMQIVFTVSPVRHTRDSMIINSRSKGQLLASIHKLVEMYPDFVSYFPSYEYVIDELRDYRWYEDDMIHPSAAAVNFIFEHFQMKYMNDTTLSLMKKLDSLEKRIFHIPRFPGSPAYQQHIHACFQLIDEMEVSLGKSNADQQDRWSNEKTFLRKFLR